VVAAHPPGDLVKGVLGVRPGGPWLPASGGLALDEGEDLTALVVEPEGARGSWEILGRQVGEQSVHGRRPGAGGTADRVTRPDGAAGVPAVKLILGHREILARFPGEMPG
jgi:hypothetical protein